MLKVCQVKKGQIPGNWELLFLTESAGTPSKWKEKLHQLNPQTASRSTIAHCKNASGVRNVPQMHCCWLQE